MPRKTKEKTKPHESEDKISVDEEPPAVNPYEILGLEENATADQIKSTYRKQALKHHPGIIVYFQYLYMNTLLTAFRTLK